MVTPITAQVASKWLAPEMQEPAKPMLRQIQLTDLIGCLIDDQEDTPAMLIPTLQKHMA